MIRVGRRPFVACAHRWQVVVDGIADGEGGVTDDQCLGLNGNFFLDFKSCVSQGNLLVWDSECVDSVLCSDCEVVFHVTLPEITLICGSETLTWPARTHDIPFLESVSGRCRYFSEVNVDGYFSFIYITVFQSGAIKDFEMIVGLFHGTLEDAGAVYINRDSATCQFPGNFDLSSEDDGGCIATGSFPSTLSVSSTASGTSGLGPRPQDRIRSKWHIEYDIESELWTFRSFDKIGYPVYTLLDSDPCVGDEKVLTMVDGTGEDGCGTSPSTMILRRKCSSQRRARDRKQSGITGKTHHLCGCDCQDENDDLRPDCSTEDPETCLYPRGSDCCDYCPPGVDPPCAYEVLFDCDISHMDESIAAAIVTLRHECYFENSCDWVALGAETNGAVGAEPVCASCNGNCPSSGCTWDAWRVADCDGENPTSQTIIDALGISWKLRAQEFATLTYQHPIFGTLEYTGASPWLCNNINTVHLTSQGSFPDGVLQQSVCIRPKYDGKCGCYDLNQYPNDIEDLKSREQCECCDPGCEFEQTLYVRCGDCFESCTGIVTKTTGGIDCPLNPAYEMTCTLCSVELKVVWYCCGGIWRADIHSGGVYCFTQEISKNCCPLSLGVGSGPLCNTYNCCVGVGGPECDPPPPVCGYCTATNVAPFSWFVTSDCVPNPDCPSATCSNAASLVEGFVGEIRQFPCEPV